MILFPHLPHPLSSHRPPSLLRPPPTFLLSSCLPPPLSHIPPQVINKTIHFDHTYTNVTIDYAQYWRVLGHWVKFLDIKRNGCEEHPVMCGAAPGTKVHVSTLHPPLNPLTPFGMYRSTQHYYDTGTGALIGCADMMIPYEK